MKKKYRLTPEARSDLRGIARYIAADNPAGARGVIDAIEARCQALGEMPGMGRSREDLGPGLRGSVCGNYIVFFREVADGIQVVRVIHGRRDISRLFE